MTATLPAVGVVGLGNMGGPLAIHLLSSGYAVQGYDVRDEAMAQLATAGGIAASSPMRVAQGSSVVFTSLPSEAALTAAVSGEHGIVNGAHESLVVVETSTLPIPAKQRARELLEERGAIMLDCPLSGTASQMRAKDAVIYASGDSGAIARCEPVFAAFARSQYVIGAFGNGMKLKLLANHLVTVHTAAAAEALMLAGRSGLDLELAFEALTDGAGTSRMLEVRGPLMLREDFSEPNMPIRNYLKDVDLISAFARETSSPLPLFAICAQLCIAAMAQGRGDEDPAAMFAVLKAMAEG